MFCRHCGSPAKNKICGTCLEIQNNTAVQDDERNFILGVSMDDASKQRHELEVEVEALEIKLSSSLSRKEAMALERAIKDVNYQLKGLEGYP